MYTKNNDGTFTVTSKSRPEQRWIVSSNITSCNCPKFKFILRGQGECHHMTEVIKGERSKIEQQPIDNKFETFNSASYTEPLHMVDFIEKYGESQLDILVAMQHVFIIKNMVRRLQ